MPSFKQKPDHARFENEVVRRGITRLAHFTPTINLLSIFEQGALLSRKQLRQLSVERPELHLDDFIEINDKLRLDKMEDHINLSVQYPNHLLFQRFRDSCRSWCDSWCVIALSPSCLWLDETLFSIGNAASSYSQRQGINGSFEKFVSLFQPRVAASNANNQRVLTRNGLADCHPTDVQAEVLVRGRIPISEIEEIYFETDEELKRSRGAISIMHSIGLPPFVIDPSLFKQRGS
jgi:hypothetical protein